MSSNVNITLSNERDGTTVSVTRRLVDYTITWTDDSGVNHTQSGTLTWPDVLTNVALPAGYNHAIQERDALAAGRIVLGVDPAVLP